MSGSAITVDASQKVYVAGINGGAFDLAQKAPIPAVEHGNQDVFLLELNAAGSQILFGSYFGGTGNDVPSGIAVDSNANIFVAGQTGSADIPVSANAFDKALSGGFGTGFVAMVSTVGGAIDAGPGTVGDAGSDDALAKDTAAGEAKGIDAVTIDRFDAGAAVDAGAGGDAPAPSDAVSKNPGGSKQGCGCRIASTEPPAAILWLLAVGFLLLARRRR